MEVDLVRRTPGSVALVRERRRASDSAKEIHAPLCSLGRTVVDIEETQWYLDVGNPQLVSVVDGCAGSNTVCGQVGNIETVECSAGGANLGGVVNYPRPESAYQGI